LGASIASFWAQAKLGFGRGELGYAKYSILAQILIKTKPYIGSLEHKRAVERKAKLRDCIAIIKHGRTLAARVMTKA